jgi:hypothetical protein
MKLLLFCFSSSQTKQVCWCSSSFFSDVGLFLLLFFLFLSIKLLAASLHRQTERKLAAISFLCTPPLKPKSSKKLDDMLMTVKPRFQKRCLQKGPKKTSKTPRPPPSPLPLPHQPPKDRTPK